MKFWALIPLDESPFASTAAATSSLISASDGCNLYLVIKYLTDGPPANPPATKPKVAAASPMDKAELTPRSSIVPPNAVAAPWPPSIEMGPITTPNKGSKSSTVASETPIIL